MYIFLKATCSREPRPPLTLKWNPSHISTCKYLTTLSHYIFLFIGEDLRFSSLLLKMMLFCMKFDIYVHTRILFYKMLSLKKVTCLELPYSDFNLSSLKFFDSLNFTIFSSKHTTWIKRWSHLGEYPSEPDLLVAVFKQLLKF